MRPGETHILSRPHPIYWAGWRSDTRTLQQAGWEFSASQREDLDEVGLAFRHPNLGLRGVTNTIPAYVYAQMHDHHEGPVFHVAWMTDAHVQVQTVHIPEWASACSPVDMKPQYVHEVKTFEDTVRFAPVNMTRTAELIVDPDDVSAMMDRILTLQDPARQKRYREAVRQGRAGSERPVPRQTFHAQIVSLAS